MYLSRTKGNRFLIACGPVKPVWVSKKIKNTPGITLAPYKTGKIITYSHGDVSFLPCIEHFCGYISEYARAVRMRRYTVGAPMPDGQPGHCCVLHQQQGRFSNFSSKIPFKREPELISRFSRRVRFSLL